MSTLDVIRYLIAHKIRYKNCCYERRHDGLANAGIPMLLNILVDTDATPLWNIYYELEDLTS